MPPERKISRFSRRERSCKHRGKISFRRLRGQMPLTPMPPTGGRFLQKAKATGQNAGRPLLRDSANPLRAKIERE